MNDPKTDGTVKPVEFKESNALDATEISVDTYLSETNDAKDVIVVQAAERFVDLVKHGKTAAQAAQAIGTTVRALNTHSDMQDAIAALVSVGELPAEVRRKMLKAGLNKIFMEGVGSDSVKERKLALEAAKLIGQDPEISLTEGDGAKVVFDLGDLAEVFKKPLTLPGIKE